MMGSGRGSIPGGFAFVLALLCSAWGARSQSSPRALLVFGDSLVDSGNNNFLATTARADNRPYGIDFPTRRPTGRFSNGLNIPDIISEHLGIEPPLPYLDPALRGASLLRGANFASAGVGILNDTGIQFVNIIRMPQQLEYFREYQGKLAAIVGRAQADRLVSQALVAVTLGGNDFVNNYYLTPFSFRSRQFSLPDYTRFIISEYKKLLATLYELGARKVMVTATGPLGCVPAERAMRTRNGECDPTLNQAANMFNSQLSAIIDELNRQFGGRIYTFANSFSMNMDFITNPASSGFATSQYACCGQGRFNGLGLCTPLSNLCSDRTKFVFWDAFHPTERANRIIVARFMNGGANEMSPVNLRDLLEL